MKLLNLNGYLLIKILLAEVMSEKILKKEKYLIGKRATAKTKNGKSFNIAHNYCKLLPRKTLNRIFVNTLYMRIIGIWYCIHIILIYYTK
jgi:hypothetical protein